MSDMCTWRSNRTVLGTPADVIEFLTEPDAIARWAPVPFEVSALDTSRLESGSHAYVAGRLAGHSVEFDVEVIKASEERLELVASGPIDLGVTYLLRSAPGGSEIDASVSVRGGGLMGRLLAKAAEALLAAGALRLSLDRLAGELRPALAT
jgi:polyketide cyclase/dehydrase/lipid transport protein